VIEHDVSIDAKDAVLAGTISVPDDGGPFPGVLMVHGSGPLDRDENMRGQRLDVFNSFAAHLAARGIASMRYDKRGCGQSTGDYWRAGYWDLVTDATAACDALRERAPVLEEHLFVLGHSEGCVIAPQVALDRHATAGLVLLTPFLENVETLLLQQAAQIERELRAVPGFGGRLHRATWVALGSPIAQQRKLIRRIATSTSDRIRIMAQPVPAKAMRELMALDVAGLLEAVHCPMLLISGEKDVQCPPGDAHRIAERATGAAEAHVVPNLTHLLRRDARPPSILGSGALVDKPVEPIVLQLVAEWITRQIEG
jgi:pimeloyl-ACP methyl ester carboxylesterase